MKRSAPLPTANVSPPPTKRKIESTTTNKTVAAFFTPASKKKPEKISWRIVNKSLIVGKYSIEGQDREGSRKRRKVAAFDLDSTLISTSSGNRFAKDATDWKWWHNEVPGRIRRLDAEGYQVIILSNQKKVSLQNEIKNGRSESKSLSNFKEKVAAVMRQLEIPMSLYAATQYDECRKPRTGMWREFLEDYDLDVDPGVDLEGSIFVGDAAGRKGDHSCVDRDFASNVGIPFKTPEEFFLDAAHEQIIRDFDPAAFLDTVPDSQPAKYTKRHPIDIVMFCGSPGAGKSTFYWKQLQPLGYERINQDILKSRQKCLKVAKDFLKAGTSVAIDNTNADPETRAHWTQLAAELKVPIRCVYFTAPPALCKHNDAVRASNLAVNPESRTILPGIAFHDFARRFREPQLSEGFEDIVRVDFIFEGDEEAKKTWSKYWI